ncbi:MAG TPA: hypothetical protein VJS45_02225 [Acidimicrobiia bacterium]|nr:hypothetical protein [Acidimicrobiia bacterium]
MRRLVHLIGPGERAWFRRCRRSWDLGSPNRRNLEPHSGPFDLRKAVRYALSVWYFPGMWEWPRAIVLPRALQAFDEAVARGQGQGQGETVEQARVMLERYFAWAPTVDAFSPVRVENDFEANIPDIRNPGQDLVDGDGRPVRYTDRVQLLVVDSTDSYWIVEHRLVDDGWADLEELLLSEPPVTAAWGWERFYLGLSITGTVHNELRISAEGPSPGEPGRDQTARHPRSRDFARSRAAARDPAAAGSPVLQAEAVVEESGEWFRRTWIRRTRAEVQSVGDRLSAEVLDMLDPNLALYPSPSPEHCAPCYYRAPCLAMNEGADPAPILTADYRPREFDRPEEGRLGGGSWSMNRGAAPPPQWRKPPP